MSVADYTQRAEDHQSLLVLIKPFGQPKAKCFSRVIDRINTVTYVTPPDSNRHVWLRYKRIVHLENSDWGDFQGHRRISGLICLGKASSEIELASVYANFDTLKEKYKASLFDSRCLVFGMQTEEAEKSTSGVRPDALYFENVEDCDQLEDHIKDFAGSLFWVLESKRLERLKDRNDRLPLLLVPFEKKDIVGIDTETRTFKRKIQGRMRKHLADLTLMAGLTQEAFNHYQTALEILRGANDWMWMGACLEGMCASSVIQHFPPEPAKAAIPRNASFNSDLLLHGEHKSFPRTDSSSTFENFNGSVDKLFDDRPKNCLTLDEINEKYKEAISHYSRYTHAAIIVLEASIKATQVLIQQKKTMEAADFLQNIVYINLTVTDQEKVQRYIALSRLYDMIGFHRKAAFFKRVAAMQCVSPQNSKPGWEMCHDLLLETMSGYKMKLDPREFTRENSCGWPVLQMRLLNELVYTSRKMGDHKLAIRYLSFLLHTFHTDIPTSELREIAGLMETITSKVPGLHQPLCVESGIILPPVPFTLFPTVKSFKLLPLSSQLAPHLQRRKLLSPGISSSPFIYSPLQSRNEQMNNKSVVPFQWVSGDVCEVSMEVYNQLPFELRVANLGFLTEGLNFDPIPAAITLPANSGPHSVSILGTPKSPGALKITGYTTNVLGVESHCRLLHLPNISQPYFMVDIVPPLPLLKVTTPLPKATTFQSVDPKDLSSSCSMYISLLAGESHECEVKLSNTGKVPVDALEVFLEEDELKEYFDWSVENINVQLPLQPGNHILFTLYIKACGHFILNQGNETVSPVNFPTTPTPQRFNELSASREKQRSQSTSFLENSNNSSFQVKLDEESLHKVIEATLKFRYSGGQCVEQGYSRISTLLIKTEIPPSLVFVNWTTLPASEPRKFHVILDVLNATSHELQVQYGEGCSLLLDSRACKRLAITIDRFTVDGLYPSMSMEEAIPGFYEEVREMYSQQLASLVDIRWHSVHHALDKTGFASVRDLPVTANMLDNIDFCPIDWQVQLNGSHHSPGDGFTIAEGGIIEVNVSVSSTSDDNIQAMHLEMEPFQDYANGRQDRTITHLVACMGCKSSQNVVISPKQSLNHSCSFLFLHPGKFNINIVCIQQRPTLTDSMSTDAQKPSGDRVWRYRPPIAVSVT